MKVVIVCLLSIGLVSGCASAVDTDWQAAQARNDVAGYKEFAANYPDSPQSSLAQQRIDQLNAQELIRTGTVSDIETYLNAHPSGPENAELNVRLSGELVRTGSASDIETYLNQHPSGPGTTELNARLDAIKTEQAARLRYTRLADARQAGTEAAYEEFLNLYPAGSDSDALRKDLPVARQKDLNRKKLEQSKRLGQLIMDMAPTYVYQLPVGIVGQGEAKLVKSPSPNLQSDLAELKSLLEAGVDPNAARIAGDAGPQSLAGGAIETTGQPGQIVPADQQGSETFLDYCETHGLDEAAKLLKDHGAN